MQGLWHGARLGLLQECVEHHGLGEVTCVALRDHFADQRIEPPAVLGALADPPPKRALGGSPSAENLANPHGLIIGSSVTRVNRQDSVTSRASS